MHTNPRVVILGAGFGGLELASTLSDQFGEEIDVVLIDKNDAFSFGFSKFDVMFGRQSADAIRLPYDVIDKPGVRFHQETVTAIDAERRVVTTDSATYEADYLVVALGADYDLAATPGLAEYGNEFYSFEGAAQLAPIIDSFTAGNAVIGVCDAPFKCPPAPSEMALLLHDHLLSRGVRDACTITFVLPLSTPVPPSPDTSTALTEAFAERDITFIPGARVASLDGERQLVQLDNGNTIPYDLFLGVPKHRAPQVVIDSGMTVDGYIPVPARTLQSRFANVWALGDVAKLDQTVPKAGVFAEGQAKVVAEQIAANIRSGESDAQYGGIGECYIEFGAGQVARVNVDFLSEAKPTGSFDAPSRELVAEKDDFGSTRRSRWFALR
jgi:sulfide:quinone oxidoreductase